MNGRIQESKSGDRALPEPNNAEKVTVVGLGSSVGTATRYWLDGPHQHWGPSSHLYNEYPVSLPETKRPGRGGDHTPSSAEVKE
jgi:hypothetical protein